jgi:hypothetical protein
LGQVSPDWTVEFHNEEAKQEFIANDCDELQSLIPPLRIDPFPDRITKHRIERPGDPWTNPDPEAADFYTDCERNGKLCVVAYFVDRKMRKVKIVRSLTQPFPP